MQVTTTILRRGSQGQAVKNIQAQLNIFGAKLVIDGIFGAATEAAVKEFQKRSGLTVDGIVGTKTLNALSQATTVPIDVLNSLPLLRRGSKGGDVKNVQVQLNNHFGANLVLDGAFGPATEAAVKKYQSQMGLVPDGIVGRLTWNALLHPFF
ncbi:peptidoglycan-binding protein [Limnoraphis robusta]|jgi:peptidoglycan hydrolase-like protein with peptidoglycan-binding domain|uniref:Peptidoglycan-binding protein n=1 Tax=Limnoraphis robusta CCNP1315 TaxID=3110306 RepID=A0ABU5U320_9CYAN|nr:peptidoglycan-binding protein [Limnoraphis robusta]MEA5521301.1 peptidoglycan-binding protein [Limnoraphis robusta CCNP1315]MEA5544855.1 peptidoglycan-binding protein [Limnoraphis robusta CCNP1324]